MPMAEDLVVLREILQRELETINAYEKMLERVSDPELRTIIDHVTDEEREHVAEMYYLIMARDPKQQARSQHGAELALENQITETVRLCSLARELGAVASSAFGAGFGGSVWAMLPDAHAERFASRWRDRYVKLFPNVAHRAQVFTTHPSAPAFEAV